MVISLKLSLLFMDISFKSQCRQQNNQQGFTGVEPPLIIANANNLYRSQIENYRLDSGILLILSSDVERWRPELECFKIVAAR